MGPLAIKFLRKFCHKMIERTFNDTFLCNYGTDCYGIMNIDSKNREFFFLC